MKPFVYEGLYVVRGNRLCRDDGTTLLISHRGDTSPSKPSRFIVDKSEPQGKYVSSLYEEYKNPQFEHNGVRYVLRWAGDRAEIRALAPRLPTWPR